MPGARGSPPARVTAWASPSKSWAPSSRPPARHGVDPARAGHLPRHGAPVGRRLRAWTTRSPSTRCWRTSDASLGPDRPRHDPPQRLARAPGVALGSSRAHRRTASSARSGLGHLVRHPRLARVPMLLETPGMDAGWDAVNMARVRGLPGRRSARIACACRRAASARGARHGPAGWCARRTCPGSAPGSTPDRTAPDVSAAPVGPDRPVPLAHFGHQLPMAMMAKPSDPDEHGPGRRIVPIRRPVIQSVGVR